MKSRTSTIQIIKTVTHFLFSILLIWFVSDQADAQPLRQLASNCGIRIGAVGDQSQDADYLNTLKREFNIVVNENALKMSSVKGSENGAYNFTGPDRLLALAEANGMKMRGHAILWYQGMPQWVKDKQWTRETLLAYLKTYIQTVVGRYKGRIEEWDVANEFIKDGGSGQLRDATQDVVWMKYIGEAVLDSAFKWVHQVDPKAKLFYNDYAWENGNAKTTGVFNLLKRLQERGVPIHGAGFQCHLNHNELPSMTSAFATQMDQNIKKLGAMGLQVSFTEIDMRMVLPGTEAKYKEQAETYKNLLQLAINNKTIVKSVLMWGFTDKHSWIPAFIKGSGDALIFKADYSPKPAYFAWQETLQKSCGTIIPKGPYSGTPITIPGTIEAENYDLGGQGISFSDFEPANLGGEYRNDGVDIVKYAQGTSIGHTANGEWLEYTVNVTKSDKYNFSFLYSAALPNGILSILVDGQNFLSNITLNNTAGWNDYKTLSRSGNLTAGKHIIRLRVENFGFNVDKIIVTKSVINQVDEQFQKGSVQVYPNPSIDGQFNLSENKSWNILNLQGGLVKSGNGSYIDLSNEISGIYLLMIDGIQYRIIK